MDALYPKHSTHTHSAEQIDYTHSNLLSVAKQMAVYPTIAALLKICAHHDEANNNRVSLCVVIVEAMIIDFRMKMNSNAKIGFVGKYCRLLPASVLLALPCALPLIILGILCNLDAYIRCLPSITGFHDVELFAFYRMRSFGVSERSPTSFGKMLRQTRKINGNNLDGN